VSGDAATVIFKLVSAAAQAERFFAIAAQL
jgi:hypothetical protein